MRTTLAIVLSGILAALPVAAQNGASWRPEERVLLSDFSFVSALARDNDVLYAVTPNGLLVYDLTAGAFRDPLTAEDGYPVEENPISITYARAEFLLIVGTARGGLFTLATLAPRFTAVARLPGPVLSLASPQTGFESYAETTAGWFRLRSVSLRPEPSAPPRPEPQPGRSDSYLASMLGTAGTVPGRPTAPVAALETGRIPGVYYAGTLGSGLVRLDTRTLERTRLPFGLNTRGVTAMARWRGRLWFGGDSSAVNGSLVSASEDLARFNEYPPRTGGPQRAITALLAADSVLWVGGLDGLAALEARNGDERWHDFSTVVREPVLNLTHAAGSVFVGTRSGAFVIRGGLAGGPAGRSIESVLTGTAVRGMARGVDTLWIASDAGLAALPLTGQAAQTRLVRETSGPIGPVADVAVTGDTVLVLTPEALYRRTAAGWSAPDPMPAAVGPLLRVEVLNGVTYVTGYRGAARGHARGAGWDYYRAPDDVPEGPVRDLLPGAETLWLATPAGALRITDRR
ncbi:MAG TPA: hypothetical protein VF035_10025 [Longimicrobiales bacterium]